MLKPKNNFKIVTDKKNKAPQAARNNACHKSSSARCLSPAPKLLAREELTAPPSAPNAIC